MKTIHTVPLALAGILAFGALGGVARAAERNQDQVDVAALSSMKVTLSQAIATAEQQTGGKTVGADLTQEKGTIGIAVELAGPSGVKTVLIDAQSGKVTASHDGGMDHEDND